MPAAPPERAAARRVAFGARVRQLRQAHGWSQEELGGRAGMGRVFVSEVEAGKVAPSLDRVMNLAEALEVPYGDLFLTVPRD